MVGSRGGLGEEELQQLRCRATQLLLKEDWKEYVKVYSHVIASFLSCADADADDADAKNRKILCSAFANRADARARLGDAAGALADCDAALAADPTCLKALMSKGRLLRDLGRCARAADCFHKALGAASVGGDMEAIRGLLEQCRRLESQAKTGAVDLSEWVLGEFSGKYPELAEYVGPVEIRRSGHGGRGLFAIKNIDAGASVMIAKAVTIGRGILPDAVGEGACESGGRMVMWKDFVDKVINAAEKCRRTVSLIYTLSTGEEGEEELAVPDMAVFKQETEENAMFLETSRELLDVGRILKVLDVNCLTEEAPLAKVLGKNGSGYCGVGLWVLPSFVNHSCHPNARRTHVGDHVIVHASRDIKAGEEVTFAYFDVLVPAGKRREAAKAWGFECRCDRCRFEGEEAAFRQELMELENDLVHGSDMGALVVRLEEKMKRCMVKERRKAFLRASFWSAYTGVFESEKLARKWGRRIPAEPVIAESVVDVVGGDERVLRSMLRSSKDVGGRGGVGCGGLEMEEKVMRIGRGTYGKVMKRQAMRALFKIALDGNNNKSL